jgi:thiol peroxidase
MSERQAAVTFKGNPLTLLGEELAVGDSAPEATLVDNDLNEVKLSERLQQAKVTILTTVPSLDTPVCSTETRTFNEKASQLGDDVQILTVSMDLPFAQSRWCGAEGVEQVETLSDYRYRQFAQAWGVLIKELQLMARAIFIVDASGTIQYIQLVPEVADEPDYQAVIEAASSIAQ